MLTRINALVPCNRLITNLAELYPLIGLFVKSELSLRFNHFLNCITISFLIFMIISLVNQTWFQS